MILRSISAVLLGAVFDLVVTGVLAAPIYVWIALQSGAYELPVAEQSDAIFVAIMSAPPAYLALLLLGCLVSMLAGYVASVIARRAPLVHGALAGSPCFALGAYSVAMGESVIPLWLNLLVMPLGPALGALGGAIWRRRPPPKGWRPVATGRVSWWRRLLIVLVYGFVIFLALGIGLAVTASETCIQNDICTPDERALIMITGWLFLGALPAVMVAGWLGFLPGARNRRGAEGR